MNHEDLTLDTILELNRQLRRIATDCTIGVIEALALATDIKGRLTSARGAYVYHAVYNTPADIRGSIYR